METESTKKGLLEHWEGWLIGIPKQPGHTYYVTQYRVFPTQVEAGREQFERQVAAGRGDKEWERKQTVCGEREGQVLQAGEDCGDTGNLPTKMGESRG